MVQRKKRRDYFYFFAKKNNFRSRAAFKLLQINKKFKFLNNANGVVDLCSAPGSWLQVCKKICTPSALVIGIDAENIKPVNGCTIIKGDITSSKCIKILNEVVNRVRNKIQVVLHDGAPKMGIQKSRDVFNQNVLVLKALRVACMCLEKKGWFITKVFRSKFLNGILYAFQFLFDKIYTIKPFSSRTESSEIFIVCKYFKFQKKINENFFSTSFIFGSSLDKFHHPNKKTRYASSVLKTKELEVEKIFRLKGYMIKSILIGKTYNNETETLYGMNYFGLFKKKKNQYNRKLKQKKKIFIILYHFWLKTLLKK